MITHFETTVTLLTTLIGLVSGLIIAVWRARGWVDRLNTTDSDLAKALNSMRESNMTMHQENRQRLDRIERKLWR